MANLVTKAKVLIIDDDHEVLQSLSLVLRRQYQVITCSEPEDGVKRVHQERPDVVLCDIKMPRYDGFWVLTEIRKTNLDVPIIFNSAYQHSQEEGDVAPIYKPFAYLHKTGDFKVFLQVIASALQKVA
jgi:CheY-like chemotaxis protein